jgi:hypothetical protein
MWEQDAAPAEKPRKPDRGRPRETDPRWLLATGRWEPAVWRLRLARRPQKARAWGQKSPQQERREASLLRKGGDALRKAHTSISALAALRSLFGRGEGKGNVCERRRAPRRAKRWLTRMSGKKPVLGLDPRMGTGFQKDMRKITRCHSGARGRREPGIQRQAQSSLLDSGQPRWRAVSGMTPERAGCLTS